MVLKWRSQKALRKLASRAKYKTLFACKTLCGRPAYRLSVPVESILIGTQCGERLEQWVERTSDYGRVSRLLSQSPYVAFLNDLKTKPECLNDHEFLTGHPYFAMGMLAIKHTGNYFNAVDKAGMLEQMRLFASLYQGGMDSSVKFPELDSASRSHRNEMIWAYQIEDSSVIELDDGHHRASCLFANGRSSIEVLIVGRKKTYLQNLIRDSGQTRECRLVEPVQAPEVRGWRVDKFAEAYWARIQEFEEFHAWLEKSQNILCLTSGYGWICKNWLERGKSVLGVFENRRCYQVGNIAYGLGAEPHFTALEKKETPSIANGIDTVCAEIGNAKSDAQIWEQLKECIDSVKNPTVRFAYIAIHPSFWDFPRASSWWSLLLGLQETFEFHSIRRDGNSLDDYQTGSVVLLALRRKLF